MSKVVKTTEIEEKVIIVEEYENEEELLAELPDEFPEIHSGPAPIKQESTEGDEEDTA